MESDESLLDAWRGGDRRAGNELFQRHFDPVRRFFVNKVDQEAAELVQKTFMRCVDAAERFGGRSSFRTFLFAIANNVLREHFRARRKLEREDDLDEHSVVDLGTSPSSAVVAKRERQALLIGLRTLPLKFQIVLELYFWEQMSGSQIGEALGLKEDTVRSRIRRGKELLAQAVKKGAASAEVVKSTTDNLERWAVSVWQQVE